MPDTISPHLQTGARLDPCPPLQPGPVAPAQVDATALSGGFTPRTEVSHVDVATFDESPPNSIEWRFVDEIARQAHEANRTYCASIGDDSQRSWDEAPDWQKESARSGVRFALDNPGVTPEQMHESWTAKKLADGWEFGPEKDERLKRHPCIRPYDELPTEQQRKDEIFRDVVNAHRCKIRHDVEEFVDAARRCGTLNMGIDMAHSDEASVALELQTPFTRHVIADDGVEVLVQAGEAAVPIIEIEVRRLVSTGNYENLTIGARALVSSDLGPKASLVELERFVDEQIAERVNGQLESLNAQSKLESAVYELQDIEKRTRDALQKYERIKSWFEKMELPLPARFGREEDLFVDE